jgi:hypothetical protein
VCPYCGTSLIVERKSAVAEATERTAVSGPKSADTSTTFSTGSQFQTGSAATAASQRKSGLAPVIAEAERVVERLVEHRPPDPGQRPTPPKRGLLVLLGTLGALVIGGGSGFAGFRVGVSRGPSPGEIKTVEDLKAQLQIRQGANASLDATVKALTRQLAEKQTAIDTLTEKGSTASADVRKMKASLQNSEQREQKAQNEAVALRNQLNAERQRPKVGMIEWSGDLGKKDDARLTVEIQNGRPSIGSLHGSLPAATCGVLSGNPAATITTPPSQGSPNRFSFQVKGKGRTMVRLFWSAC